MTEVLFDFPLATLSDITIERYFGTYKYVNKESEKSGLAVAVMINEILSNYQAYNGKGIDYEENRRVFL